MLKSLANNAMHRTVGPGTSLAPRRGCPRLGPAGPGPRRAHPPVMASVGHEGARITRDKVVFQIRIELLGVEPPIWRRIEVPEHYSFWDLHVAIQDAMGWQDSHVHHFRLIGSELVIGIPDEDGDDTPIPERVRDPIRGRMP